MVNIFYFVFLQDPLTLIGSTFPFHSELAIKNLVSKVKLLVG